MFIVFLFTTAIDWNDKTWVVIVFMAKVFHLQNIYRTQQCMNRPEKWLLRNITSQSAYCTYVHLTGGKRPLQKHADYETKKQH